MFGLIRSSHLIHVGTEVLIQGGVPKPEPQQIGGDPEAVVGRLGQNDLWLRDPCQIARQSQRRNVGLCAAAGYEPHGLRITEERRQHAHSLFFELIGALLHFPRPLNEEGPGRQLRHAPADGVRWPHVADAEVIFHLVGVQLEALADAVEDLLVQEASLRKGLRRRHVKLRSRLCVLKLLGHRVTTPLPAHFAHRFGVRCETATPAGNKY